VLQRVRDLDPYGPRYVVRPECMYSTVLSQHTYCQTNVTSLFSIIPTIIHIYNAASSLMDANASILILRSVFSWLFLWQSVTPVPIIRNRKRLFERRVLTPRPIIAISLSKIRRKELQRLNRHTERDHLHNTFLQSELTLSNWITFHPTNVTIWNTSSHASVLFCCHWALIKFILLVEGKYSIVGVCKFPMANCGA